MTLEPPIHAVLGMLDYDVDILVVWLREHADRIIIENADDDDDHYLVRGWSLSKGRFGYIFVQTGPTILVALERAVRQIAGVET